MSTLRAESHAGAVDASKLYLERWNFQHRMQHFLFALSMIGLIVSGFLIKYAYVGWARWMLAVLGGVHPVLIFHKTMAVLLTYASVHHVIYLLVYWRRHGPTWDMVPTRKDLQDAIQHARALLNLGPMPKFDRYTYLEKFEYFSVFWGMAVMGLSGLMLWFPEMAGRWVPGWMLDIARIFHSNEAFVAMLALFYGHFFVVHFNPDVFPTSTVWYNGKISLQHMLHEHPLELERLKAEGKLPAEWVAALQQHHEGHYGPCGWRRVLTVVEILLYSALFYWLLITFLPMLLS